MNGEDSQRLHNHYNDQSTIDEIEAVPLRKATVHLKSSADLERNSQRKF